jgi:phage gpG-like protein
MIRMSWSGTGKQVETLRRVGLRLADLSPATKAGAEVIKTLIDDSFRRERDPWGNAWKPFDPDTLKARRQGKNKKATKGKLLTDTGTMRASMSAVGEEHAIVFGSVFEGRRHPTTGALVTGYAAAHQYGTHKGLPARSFLPVRNGRVDAPSGTPAGKAIGKVKRIIGDYIRFGTTSPVREAAE